MNQNLFEKIYSSLNSAQKEAVDSIEGPVMAIAGAGTGKTQILAVRIAKILLETQINPENILCLTFTDSGVVAMRERLNSFIGTAAYHVKIATFHGFCNEIIQENPDDFVFKREFQQVDDLEQVEIFQQAIDTLETGSALKPASEPYLFLNEIKDSIRNLKKENISPQNFKIIINEYQKFISLFLKLTKDFTEIKGSPSQEILENFHNKIQNPLLEFSNEDHHPEAAHLLKSSIKFYFETRQNYQNSLTGEKRKDSTLRTAFKNNLKKFTEQLENQIPKQLQLADLYLEYQKLMENKGRYDYEDMIMFVTKKFESSPVFLRRYQERFQYILVDEYQDTNSSQNLAVNLLGNYFDIPNIFVVGDDDQSIYRFQGASIENIIDFYETHKNNLKIITLTQNYRSQQTILDAANAAISNNQTRIATHINTVDKNLKSASGGTPAPISLAVFSNEQAEAQIVATQIGELIDAGVPPAQIAVLYRNHHNADDLTEILAKKQIPFHLHAGNNILKDLQITKLLSLFEAISEPHNNEFLINALFLDFIQVKKSDILKLSNFYTFNRAERRGISLFSFIQSQQNLNGAQLQNANQLQNFIEKIIEYKEYSKNQPLTFFFEKVIRESGYLTQILESKNKISALNRLNTLFKEVKKISRDNHQYTISDFLQNLELRRKNKIILNEIPLPENKNAVQLLTAHGAKGLEFEHVFLIKCTENIWNNYRDKDRIKLPHGLIKAKITDKKLEAEEDERRLFYVALTRAKKNLQISYSNTTFTGNKEKPNTPASFILEIPEKLLHKIETEKYEKQATQDFEELMLTETPDYTFIKDQKSYFKELLKDLRLSPTSLNNYLICPRRFLYQNLIKIPGAKSLSQSFGTAIHAALNQFFRKYKKTAIKPPLDLLLLEYQAALDKEIMSKKDFQEKLEYGRKVLQQYYEHNFESFDSDTTTELAITTDGTNLEGIPLTGKIDKITREKTDPQKIIVTDFKTGNPDSKPLSSEKGRDYARQIIFYKILCDNSTRFKRDFPNAKISAGQLEYIEQSRAKKTFITQKIDFTPETENEVKNTIKMVWQQINNLEFEKIERSDPCEMCQFKKICWPI